MVARELIESYGRVHHARAEVAQPATVAELAATLARCAREGRHATFRAAGRSFHDQALSDDVVISLTRFDRILGIDPVAQTITVEPGVTWGRIVEAALAHGLLPYVVVTTAEATAGGTLSSDAISRHSPAYGSESAHVVGFELCAPGLPAPRWIARPRPGDDGQDARIFRAVIGGFGYLGAITRITYRLLGVRDVDGGAGELSVATRLATVESFRELCATQHRAIESLARGRGDLEAWDFPRRADREVPAVYSVSFLHRGDGRGAVYRSWYCRGKAGWPYFVYLPRSRLVAFVGVLASFTRIRRLGQQITWRLMRLDSLRETVFVNELRDYLFFMDGNLASRRLADRVGLSMPVIQQTFVVPVETAAAFLDEVPELLEGHGVTPTLFDVLYMPRDNILMSASRALEGFAATLAFEDLRDERKHARTVTALHALSERCLAHGGRIHLTKNVHASAEVLAAMYGTQLLDFLSIKRQLDPSFVLQNAFFERVFAAPAAVVAADISPSGRKCAKST